MKKTMLLAVAFGCLLQAQAQSTSNTVLEKKIKANKARVVRMLGMQTANSAAQKPTGLKHRVIGQATQETGGTVDSAAFRYSGAKGSAYNYDSYDLTYNQYFEGYYAPMPILPTSQNPMNLLADSILYYDNGTLGEMATAVYRTDNKLTNGDYIELDPTGDYYTREADVYNSQGHITATYMLEGEAGSLDTISKRNYTYNTTFSQITSDSTFEKEGSNYTFTETWKYFYSSTGKLDSIRILGFDISSPDIFGLTQRITYDYYPDGKFRGTGASLYNTDGSVSLWSVDTFGYTAGIDYTTLWDRRVHGSGMPDTVGERRLKFPGISGLPDSMIRYTLNAGNWVEEDRSYYSHTSFGAPEKLILKNNGNELGQIRFYYEAYDDGVSGISSAENKNFKTYPNPFHNAINIDWSGKAQSAATVRLLNILGQEVFHSAIKLNAGTNMLQIPAINSGNYILMLTDAEGKSWSSKVVKQ